MIPCSDSLQCVKSTYRLTKSLFFQNNSPALNKPSSVACTHDDDDEEGFSAQHLSLLPSLHLVCCCGFTDDSNRRAVARVPADSGSLDNSPNTPKLNPPFTY